MLVAAAAPVGDALAAQKFKVALNAGRHRAQGEIAKLLAMLLTVQDGGPQCFGVEVIADRREVFVGDRRDDGAATGAVIGLL
jgi:hypothetical protein